MKLGTYAIEQDYSHYVSRASDIIFAIVGTATKGPVNTPTVCTSVSDFINKFGNLSTNCLGLYAGQYFLHQASKIYYVRAASAKAAKSLANLKGKSASSVEIADALVLEAKTPGTAYDGLTITVTIKDEGATFTLVVKSKSGATIETIKDVPFSSLTTNISGESVLIPNALKSNYVDIKSISSTATALVAGTYTFAGGDDGISDITSAEYILAGQTLINDNIDMNLFAVPGVSDASVIVAMLQIAETRGDCMYLVDSPDNLDSAGIASWHNGEGEYEHERFNSSYGALYWSWQKIYDSVNRVSVTVPPSVVVAPAIARSVQNSAIWYAPAGLQRGLVQGVIEPVVAPASTERDFLYTEGNNVNCIVTDPQVGICIFGQKTLYRQNTALDRVNVRMLLNYLKRVIVAACRSLTFEPNDKTTWNSFEDMIRPTLRNIQNHRGLYDYEIVKGESIVTDEDIDNYRMPCQLLLRPTKSAEEIPIYFTLTSTGAEFNDILESSGISVDTY